MANKVMNLGITKKELQKEYERIKRMNLTHSTKGIWKPKISNP